MVKYRGVCGVFRGFSQHGNHKAVDGPGGSADPLAFPPECWLTAIKKLEFHFIMIRATNRGISRLNMLVVSNRWRTFRSEPLNGGPRGI